MTNVLVIGTGGVGAIVAYGIDYTGKSNLSVVVRRDYEKVLQKGWQITSCDYGEIKNWKPANIFPSIEAARKIEYDFVVITTKNLPDITPLHELITPVITPAKTSIILMQNGFDLGTPFIEKYPENVVISGVSMIGSHNNNGTITHIQPDKTTIGFFDNPNLSKEFQESKTKEFISIYNNDKNSSVYNSNTKETRYRKLVYNASLNSVAALTGIDTGRLLLSGGMESISIPIMREIKQVAKADGVILPDDIINTMVHSDDGDWYQPSMLIDVKKGNPIELEVIVGNLSRVAHKLNVPTPTLDLVYLLLKVVQFKLKESNGIITIPKEFPISDKYYE
ncbi:ketopantoate reductase [Hyphopichia burtonii NRRL Y-1933]|uniref:Ketopantoate reductase n=1 Tax=Hyphopichia burtonii NRRL Y-1933 TaxID=984485 RepID=A0A1E4RPZ5_9ASCO|nr:ketopantoate reductase [Hyphopichia burtonii NRRL Y-1933]ODV69354.1 ketopantoate reductase [Hyphopichia burtonii NRRL Y-1933]